MRGGGFYRFLRFDVHLNFRTKTHSPIAVSIRLGVDQSRAAMGFIRLATGDFRGHSKGGFNGHADLKRGGSNEEKAAAGDVGGFGEVLDLGGSQSQGAKTQRDTDTKALELSAFRRRHVNLQTGEHCGWTRILGWRNYVNRGGERVKENCVVLKGEYSRYRRFCRVW